VDKTIVDHFIPQHHPQQIAAMTSQALGPAMTGVIARHHRDNAQ